MAGETSIADGVEHASNSNFVLVTNNSASDNGVAFVGRHGGFCVTAETELGNESIIVRSARNMFVPKDFT
jgi:hypothetical protein